MVNLSRRRLFSRATNDDDSLRLPWLTSVDGFIQDCTRCGKCIEACENKIIEKGDGGFPTVNFSIDECTFCYQCAETCPEPLFERQESTPWLAEITINNQCLAYNNVECRSCSDVCDAMVIKFTPELGKVAQPKLELDECTGCGACVSVCPTSAIKVSNVKNNER
ncbi:ferredoxin-type protein NapF [Vibrio sp. YMD68]|uniref:ferredoxin-type protein NapF n=1 Tax=Vibrio sp. YMD68 TaxID=3042300 RepID=UPI00249B9E76|nr:ferredoxin-type protein NapF [Vibrio sp. YMD68]WGV98204.1 ferredoxin-type protein NapF [Vibrio sp. YMD68]